MLVVNRKIGESIKIGDNITIKVVRVRTGQVQLAIEAPKDILILRQELLDRKVAPCVQYGKASCGSTSGPSTGPSGST